MHTKRNPNIYNRLSEQPCFDHNRLMNPNSHNRLVAGSNPAEPTYEPELFKNR